MKKLILSALCIAILVGSGAVCLEIRHSNFRAASLAAHKSGAIILVKHSGGRESYFDEWYRNYPRNRGFSHYVIANDEILFKKDVLEFLKTYGASCLEIWRNRFEQDELSKLQQLAKVKSFLIVDSDMTQVDRRRLKISDGRFRFHDH